MEATAILVTLNEEQHAVVLHYQGRAKICAFRENARAIPIDTLLAVGAGCAFSQTPIVLHQASPPFHITLSSSSAITELLSPLSGTTYSGDHELDCLKALIDGEPDTILEFSSPLPRDG